MKTKYKYIHFEQTKNNVWICLNSKHGEVLGYVKWDGPWRQYCYYPDCPAVYSKGCLEDINDFITQLSY